VRASENPSTPVETYEFAIAVRLDNTKDQEQAEAGMEPAGAL
jgi:hypothetical protein